MNRIKSYIVLIGTAAGMAILATGCYDDPDWNNTDKTSHITYSISVAKSGRDLTRGSGQHRMFGESIRMEDTATGDTLYLHPMISDFSDMESATPTRGNMVNSADEMYSRFCVSAYQYADTWDMSHLSQAPNYFESEVAQKSGNIYDMSPQRYWPEDGKIRFMAHSPVADNAFTFYPTDDAGRGPRIHIKVAEDVANQNDLLISYSEEIECDGSHASAPLNFKHALTGVRFVCDKKMPKGIITNITISGVRYEGDLFYNVTTGSQSSSPDVTLDANYNAWELYDRTFSLPLNHTLTGTDNDLLNDGEATFMMLPQTLPANAKVEITLQHVDSGGNPVQAFEHISGNLSGKEWPAGKIVTYKISTSAQQLEVTEPDTFDYLGNIYNPGDDSFVAFNTVRVASYAGDKNMKWKVEYQDEGSSAWASTSSWLSVDPTWSWQDDSEQDVRFVAKSIYNTVDIDKNLKSASAKGSSAVPYNLAGNNGASAVANTANSYIVNSPGYYILPLVYGNAIKNGATNQSAYIYSGASGGNILSTFKNHLGAGISAPYISDNSGCVPDHAAIVWQDAQNLVQNVQYVPSAFGGKGGIKFYVNPANIKQGNAVLSINDKSNVMWSWHIWVTSFDGIDQTLDVTNQDGQAFSLLPFNLGWCSNGETLRYYPRHTCKVRFTPTEGDTSLSEEITFIQESHISVPLGNNPYYQWGRKDPFVGTNIAWGNKERWDGTGKYYGTGSENNPPRLFNDLVEDTSSIRLTTKQCLDILIKNPEKWLNPPAKKGGSSYVSTNETYTNLWGDNTLSDTKTVYDPCPPGYQVNYFYTYTGFLDSGYNWSSDKGIEFVRAIAPDWDGSNQAEFYTDSSKLHSITFPVCGYRDWNDKAEVVDFKVRGFVWLRGISEEPEAYMFRYAPHISGVANVAPVTKFFSTDGLPIRPAKI